MYGCQNSTATSIHVNQSPSVASDDEQESTSTHGFLPRVLLVDDEQAVLDGLQRALTGFPYSIHTTTSAELALHKFWEEPFDVIVADERMPGMRGSELLTIIAKEFPTTGRVLLTGHATVQAAARAINEAGVVRFLLKPCHVDDLRDALEAALKLTPFEKRIRGRRRPYLVSHRDVVDVEVSDTESGNPSNGTQALIGGALAVAADQAPATHGQLEANELVLQAQKVVDLNTEMLVGYELSARLQSRDGNTHTISNFISSSGQHVLLASVDRWVVRHVLKVIREHRHALEQRGLTISLNLATQSLADPEFVRFVDRELSNARVAARFLIEVREAALAKSLRKEEGALAQLLAMRCYDMGARLCVDGIAGALWKLAILTDLPVAVAKIDSRFICNILTDSESESVVRAAVEWGKRKRVAIGATGVDTTAIAARLRALGVSYGQGSAFGTAEPVGLVLPGLYC
jgi:EAL domain-containing protein (putative c-di-GMP-specific phosphodiesterase class I)/CheY-like chemotaxis protein